MQVGVRRFPTLMPYEPTWRAMKAFTEARTDTTQDELWLLQHKPVFTQGQAGKPEHVLFPGDIPVVQTDRGGQVTYHGPGQWMVYVLADLSRLSLGPRELVDRIEQAIVSTLAEYNVQAYPKKDAPGVYVDERKIASLGLRIRKGLSFHGLALNVDMDLEPFQRINPCGYSGMEMTQVKALRPDVDIDEVGQKLIQQLTRCMGYESAADLGNQLP